MHLSKLITALKVLDKPAFCRFGEYVHSPYFKVPVHGIALFDYLEKCYPDFKESKIQPEVIARKAKGLNTASLQAFGGSKLLQAFGNFIAMEDCPQNGLGRVWHQLNGFKKLHLFEQFDKEYALAQEQLNANPEQDIDVFFYRHRLLELSINGFDANLRRNQHSDLAPVIETLDAFYALKKMRYLCELINRKNVLGIDYEDQHVDRLLEILKPYNNDQYPYVRLFINVFRMLSADSFEDSEIAYLIIKQIAGNYTGDKLLDCIGESAGYAMVWCLRWKAQGYEQASGEYLWWIDFKSKWNLLLENGKIMPIVFRNVVVLATLAGNNGDWVRRFIHLYKENLPENGRETNVAFAMGLYNYSLKNYSVAIRYFLEAQVTDEVVFKAMIRQWQWMATYEANNQETDILLDQLVSFEKYMQRNKTEFERFKVPFNSFIAYTRKLLTAASKDQRIVILESLNAENYFPGRDWLKSQFTFLLQKSRSHPVLL